MAKNARPSVNDSILLSLRGAKVPNGPPLAAAPASVIATAGPSPGSEKVSAHPKGGTPGESKAERPTKETRIGRRAPDKPTKAETGGLAGTAAFTLYAKDAKRIEDAITTLRNQGVTEGNNRSAIVRMAVMMLPKDAVKLARLFEALRSDNK